MSRVVAVELALVAFFWQASRYPAQPNSDDAYISFRYAENLAHGQGLVFNPGERVEGYTNLLWVVLLAGLHRLGVDTPRAAYLLSLLLGAVTIALVSVWLARLAPPAAVLAALACMLTPALLRRPSGVPRALVWAVQGVAMLAAGAALAVPGLRQAGSAEAVYAQFTGKWVHLGRVLRGALPAGTTIALSPVGAIPYFSGLPTIDILGLTDAHVARVPADPTIARKGHQKHDGAYILSRKPAVLLLGNGVIVSRDRTRPGELWWWPNAGFGPDGRLVPGQRLDWWREGFSLRYEADIEANPEFARVYKPALLPLQVGFDLLLWLRLPESAPRLGAR